MSGSLPAQYPDALQPATLPGKPNEGIQVYEGPVEFTQGAISFRADGTVRLSWLPSPRVRFDIPALPTGVYPSLQDPICLGLSDGTLIPRGHLTGISESMGQDRHAASASGRVDGQVIRPADADVAYCTFLLPNFEAPIGHAIAYPDRSNRAARLILVGGGWRITLDEVEDHTVVYEFLKKNSGFGVTQVGRLEREDGEAFKATQALAIINATTWYLSFAAGRWTGPCLLKGFSRDGKQAWEAWHVARIVSYRFRLSWMDGNHNDHLELPFAGFLKLWLDESWSDVIRLAMHWHIEANACAGSMEGSIVLTQTAFELLSSAVLVENLGWLSSDGYEKLAAADRIRLLLRWAGIPTGIPPDLDDLTRVAKADNWPDSPTAMTMIRNTITHPTRKNRQRFGTHGSGARQDAWALGLWNLELCLLRLFEYRGSYANRLKWRYRGEVVPVPWATSGSA